MKQWSLSKKIWAMLGMLAFAFVISTGIALLKMNEVRNDLNEITEQFVRRDQLASEIRDNQRQISIALMESILESDRAKADILTKRTLELEEEQKKTLSEYRELASEKGRELTDKYKDAFDHWVEYVNKAENLALENKDSEAFEVVQRAAPYRAAQLELLKEMGALSAKRLAEKSAEANQLAKSGFWVTLSIATISIFSSLVIAFFVLRALTQAVNSVVKSLFDSTLQVTSAAGQIAASSQSLSQSATEQASSLEETAASIEEMSSMVSKNSENAKTTASTSSRSQATAERGQEVVGIMMRSMEEINQSNAKIMEQINHSNSEISEIVKVIQEIGTKTKVINDIVFQTKLLSFNASVEAARAGEHGKGFAVVAEEVGNLAQMSGNAAKEITSLLDGSIQKVESIVNETKTRVEQLIAEGRNKVESGNDVAKQCRDVLEEIVKNVNEVSQLATEISTASQEQDQGVRQINTAMSQLDQLTQQNAATSEEAASAAESLARQADLLKSSVELLITTIQGGSVAQMERDVAPDSKSMGASSKNVLPIKRATKAVARPVPQKIAVGDNSKVPSHQHPGFDEI